MAGGAGSLKIGAIGLGAGGAASDYFTGDYYLVPTSTNLLLEDDVSSFVMPTDAAVLPYFLLISSCFISSTKPVVAETGAFVLISGMIISNFFFLNYSSNF